MLIFGSAGFASLFLGIEMLSLPAFALIVQGQGHTGPASEGAFKYLVLSSVASALLLFGVSLAYGSDRQPVDCGLDAGPGRRRCQAKGRWLLVMSGLFLKAAVFPFHAWAPDAYASTRLQVTATDGLAGQGGGGAGAGAHPGPRCGAGRPPAQLVGALAIVSIVFGNMAALGRRASSGCWPIRPWPMPVT
jgi:NADH-quinone oxidoreductase subunit N